MKLVIAAGFALSVLATRTGAANPRVENVTIASHGATLSGAIVWPVGKPPYFPVRVTTT
jgi:hypothetical protein